MSKCVVRWWVHAGVIKQTTTHEGKHKSIKCYAQFEQLDEIIM